MLFSLLKFEQSFQGEIDFKINNAPTDITLEITRECPLNCKICSSFGGEPHPLELSLDKWIGIIDESIELGAKSFLISGGEPFSSSYFKEICEYISNKGVSLSIYTSGNHFNGLEIGPLQSTDLIPLSTLNPVKLVFSLQGSRARTHDSITYVKGSFNNTLSSIRLALELGLYTEVHFVPTKMNYQELPDVVSLAKKIGVKKVSVLRFVPQGRGKVNESRLKLEKDDLIRLRDIFHKLSEHGDYVRIGSPFNPFLLSKTYKCTAGRKRMTVRYDGRVVPCEAMKFMAEEFEGEVFNDNNVRRYSLKDIWEHSTIFQMARSLHKSLSTECNSCDFLFKCSGGCPAQSILTGSFEAIDPYCIVRIGLMKKLLA